MCDKCTELVLMVDAGLNPSLRVVLCAEGGPIACRIVWNT